MAKRRGRGEGAVFERKDLGKWVSGVDLGWVGGRRKRKLFYCDTKTEAQDKILQARSDLKKGLLVLTERQTVAQFLDDWLENTIRQKSAAAELRILRDHRPAPS